jgi:shikimate 5-dehydrogenase
VIGSPVLQSAGPKYHNERFQKMFKDLIYLPLEADSPEEALEAIQRIPLLGASVTMPLKESLSALMGFNGPNNTIWHRADGDAWQVANTDAVALEHFLTELPKGPVLVLGSGGVAKTSIDVAAKRGHALMHSRRTPLAAQDIAALAPVGAIQATSLGMGTDDPLPFQDILEAALSTLRWAVEWVNREDTAFMAWAKDAGLRVVSGAELFEAQAAMQSRIFVGECGG